MDIRVYFPSRRGFLKGLAVGAGGYALGSFLIHPKEALGRSIRGYLEKVSMETRWSLASGGLAYNDVKWAKTLFDKEGKDKYLEFRRKNSPLGAASDKNLADRLGFAGNEAKSAAAIIPAIITIWYGPQQKYEIEESTAEKARVKCLECSFWNAMQTRKVTDDLCSLHSQIYWDSFAKAINPSLKSTMLKAKPLGDPVCEWVIELKA
jgi:hypothetical protein